MKTWTANDVREAYLSFFESKGHRRVKSAPLVPENDSTTLFTGSGMQPMLPYLLGEPHALGSRIVDSQKSFRTGDIEEVGDNRHTTFFEMLGNWSFGDYFKDEQIKWIFDWLVQELGLEPSRLFVSVFVGNEQIGVPKDEESVKIWQESFKGVGIEAKIGERIFYYGEEKNWWSRSGVPAKMPAGEPGGPDSEIFWDFGVERGLHEGSKFKGQPCHINCDCGRWLEIGNNVFMEYRKTETGFEKLEQRNVDFGGGLERILAALANEPDIFRSEIFDEPRRVLEKLTAKLYGENEEETRAFRLILDHLRAATFLIGDAVLPSNKDQGYFVRRLIRRAIRFGDQLGIKKPFSVEVAGAVIENYRSAYGELANRQAAINQELTKEEDRFRKTLKAGLKQFEKVVSEEKALTAPAVFDLYQSFGFPWEMTAELAEEQGLKVNQEEFEKLKSEHQKKSRTGGEQKFKGGLADTSEKSIHYHTATHLLHQALRQILGEHVWQKGSNITPERLRFDFSHPTVLTKAQRQEVEELVNQKIQENLIVKREVLTIEQARTKGALGLFAEKYGEQVSVYSMGNFSCEICGGPHVTQTGKLGTFKIMKEESAGAGVRRIKAVLT
jgi:alanyl-tRNA synthetase